MSVETFTNKNEFDAAVAQARTAAASYYDSATLILTDAEYDALTDSITATLAEHPEWDVDGTAATLLDSVAAGASAGGDVTHPVPMLSLGKATETAELTAFLERLGNVPTITEVKLDGMAVRAVYRAGELVLVATRGDGTTGEDVTAQARNIAGLPRSLNKIVDVEVRGEVFMTETDFETASANRVAAGKAAFVNPRNATAGTLRTSDSAYTAPLSFAAYDIFGDDTEYLTTYSERMGLAHAFGLTTAISLLPDITPGQAPADIIAAIAARRDTLGFPIDGAVVKVDFYADRERLGAVSRTPRWALAWKYPAAEARSVLRDIEVAVGRTGRISLTGIIDPVFVAGATVTRATLHNPAFITDQGLGIGSVVVVVRANDVIPRITAALGEQPANLTPWVAPTVCPQCGETWDTSSLLWRCHTPACSAAGWLQYFCSRDALDIERVGEAICDALVENGLAKDPADLYDLTEDQWANLPVGVTNTGAIRRLGAVTAKAIVDELTKSKTQPFHRVLTGLGIRMTGRSVSRWLARRFPTMPALQAATVEDIADIDKMGPIKAKSVVDGLAALAPVIARLAAHGLAMAAAEEAGDKPFSGKTYVVSGSVPGYTRTTIQEAIEKLGGTASSSVSVKTTALVTAEADTSKAKKAAELGIPVIDPAEFAATVTAHLS